MIHVTAAIIRSNGKILICRRGEGGNCAHLWEFPGGKIEAGETPFQCIVREIQEELSLEIKPLHVVDEYAYSYPDKDIMFTFIEAEIVSGELQPLVHEEICWVVPEKFQNYEWCPADTRVVERIVGISHH